MVTEGTHFTQICTMSSVMIGCGAAPDTNLGLLQVRGAGLLTPHAKISPYQDTFRKLRTANPRRDAELSVPRCPRGWAASARPICPRQEQA